MCQQKQIKMKTFIPPKKILGTIKVNPKDLADKYYIGEANLAIEKVGEDQIIYIWAKSFHYELQDEKEVKVGDVIFEIMQPIVGGINVNEINKIDFPEDIEKVENYWEELYYGHFYQFEHLKISKWGISILFNSEERIYNVEVKGYITDDIRETSDKHFFESTFKTKLENKINSRYNWNYSLDNQNAKNKS